MPNTKIIGPDVSFYQYKFKDLTLREVTQYIDFSRMRTMTPAVIIRAGQNLWPDRMFSVSWTNAKRAGMYRGSYWFFDSRAEPKRQAELWVSLLGDDSGELPLFVDLEENYNGLYQGWENWYTFIERLKQLLPGKEILIYTGYYWWFENTIGVSIPAASLDYFKQYDLWIANYGGSKPLIPKPWTDWTLWQYTDNGIGADYGVASGNIDLSYFNGNEEEFRKRFMLSNPAIGQGIKIRMFAEATMKGVAKAGTQSNIKPMDGSAQLATLFGGQYVYGEKSVAGTDIINFSHYYKADKTKVPLAKPCKVTTANLILSNEIEPPGTEPPPTPEPEPTPEPPPVEEPIKEFREIEFTQKFVLVNGEEVLRVRVMNPNPTTKVEVFVGDGINPDVQWFRPE